VAYFFGPPCTTIMLYALPLERKSLLYFVCTGNENIHLLTSTKRRQLLRVDLGDFEGNSAYAEYNNFTVGSVWTKYQLTSLGQDNGDNTAGQHSISQNKPMPNYRQIVRKPGIRFFIAIKCKSSVIILSLGIKYPMSNLHWFTLRDLQSCAIGQIR